MSESKRQIVHVSDHAESKRKGQEAIVVKRQARRRGPRTTNVRFNYLLRFADGHEMWFWDTEVES